MHIRISTDFASSFWMITCYIDGPLKSDYKASISPFIDLRGTVDHALLSDENGSVSGKCIIFG